jgi:hypothetical protein
MFISVHLSSEIFCKVNEIFRGYYPMKLIIRTVAVALALTGAFASTQISSASTSAKVSVARNSAMPVPRCAPDDPNACGIAR